MTTAHQRAAQPADNRLQRLLAGLTAVRSGEFSTRLPAADDPLMDEIAGTWKRLTGNVSQLAGNLTRQVRAIAGVTSAVASSAAWSAG